MKRYETYKDSGVKWIGEIPNHWQICKIKHRYNIVTGFTPDTKRLDFYDESNGETWVTIADLNGKYINDSTKYVSEKYIKEFNPEKVVKGSLLYSFKLSVGQVAFATKDLYTNEAIASFIDNDKICLPFMYYAAPIFIIQNANVNIYGAKILNQDLINNAITIFPPLPEQKAIAEWLDVKCAEIDKLIATQQRRIELLQELRQSIITRAVTRGIYGDAPLRDSGIEWIGQIPEHWEIAPFKRYMTINNGRDYKEFLDDEIYPVMGSGGCFAYCSKYLYDGEAVLLGRKGTIDKPLYINEKFWAVDTMFYAIPNNKVICKYMYFQALTFPFNLYSTSTALPSMTQTDLGNNPVTCPPLDEQREIVTYIERETGKVDHALRQAERQIELLQELRQSVITEVVTGKRKVC